MMEQQQEKELVLEAQQGKQEAKEQLCEKYYPEVLKMSRMILKDWNKSQDIAQGVFCRVFVQDKIKSFKGKTSLKSWLFVVTRNTCYSYLRQKSGLKKTGVLHFLDNCEAYIPAKGIDAEEWIIQKEEAQMLNHAVRKLPDIYRKAIEYRYFREYSYQEAAKRMGISIGHFGLRKIRAEKRLRKIVKRYDKAADKCYIHIMDSDSKK